MFRPFRQYCSNIYSSRAVWLGLGMVKAKMTRGPQRAAEPVSLDGGPLGTLAFQWQGDRFGHAWHIGGRALMESVEGPLKTAWPDAPPLQQVSQQSFGDGRKVVFGVGMAGRGHWSASYTLIPDLRCWIVELACRWPIRPQQLISTYRTEADWHAADDGCWELSLAEQSVKLEPIQPTTTLSRENNLLRLVPTVVSDVAPSTTQWAFRLHILP
jgi:hypothetical protein